jgi:hypothetical protein
MHHQHRVHGYRVGAYCCPIHGPQEDASRHLRRLLADRHGDKARRIARVRARLMAMPEPTAAQVALACLLTEVGL